MSVGQVDRTGSKTAFGTNPFDRSEEEDVELWIRKIEYIADTHGVSGKVLNLAASQKLAKDA